MTTENSQFPTIQETIKWCLLSAIWMGVIFLFSAQAHSGAITETYLGAMNVPIRKCGHMFEYFVLCLLYAKALRITDSRIALKALALTILYALSDEWHQSFVAGRSSSLWDVGVDTIGAMIALVFRNFIFFLK